MYGTSLQLHYTTLRLKPREISDYPTANVQEDVKLRSDYSLW